MLRSSVAIFLSIFFAVGLVIGEQAAAEEWPTDSIKAIVPFAAGGGTDTSARQLQPYLEEELGVPLEIENRGGGNTIVGTKKVLSAEPNGYTIGISAQPHTNFGIVALDAPYSIDELTFVGRHVFDPGCIRIHNEQDHFSTFEELLDYARENPKQVTFSVSTVTSSNYLGLKLIEEEADVKFNIVSFGGGNPARIALAGQHVTATHCPVFASQMIADSTKVIAVHRDGNPYPELTDNAPTVNEVLDADLAETGSQYMMFTSAEFKEKYPERFEKLSQAYENALQNPEFIQEMKDAEVYQKWDYIDSETANENYRQNIKDLQKYKEYFE